MRDADARTPKTPLARALRAGLYLILCLTGVTMLFPLAWMLLTSVKPTSADPLDLKQLWPAVALQIGPQDVIDWNRLLAKVRNNPHLWNRVDAAVRDRLRNAGVDELAQQQRAELLGELNRIARTDKLWLEPGLTGATTTQIVGGDAAIAFNRKILNHALSGEIRPPRRFHWENYAHVWLGTNLFRSFLNSFFVTSAITLGQVFTSSLAAYAFARLQFPWRDRIFLSYLATMMIPAAVTMIPTFILLRELEWIDSYKALIIPSMFSAYGTFMLRQFFMSIPLSLEEAAVLDGCSRLGVYWHIMLPLSKPALTALGIITFMGAWRTFMWPLIVTHQEALFTLPVALAAFQDMYDVRWPLLMAGSVIMIVPMLVVFLFGQRFFISGITVGAVKG